MGIDITPNGAFVNVAGLSGTVFVIDTATNTVSATAPVDNALTGAACNQLSSFINQVTALINAGSLSASQGQSLIDAANTIGASLRCLL